MDLLIIIALFGIALFLIDRLVLDSLCKPDMEDPKDDK